MIKKLIKKIFKNECEFPEFIFYHHTWASRHKKVDGWNGYECVRCGRRAHGNKQPRGGWI